MIVVLGASGMAGTPAIAEMVKRGVSIRCLTSSQASADKLYSRGVAETVIGDFNNRDDIARAIEGAERVLFIPPSMHPDQAEIGKRVVESATAARIPHLVMLSSVQPQIEALPHHWAKLQIEQAIVTSGLNYTILQPSSFMQNFAASWNQVQQESVIRSLWDPTRALSRIDTRDLGEIIALSLTSDRLVGGTFELCSSDKVTTHEIAEIVSVALGRPIRAERQDLEIFSHAMANVVPPGKMQNILTMARYFDSHNVTAGNPLVATAILGREPRTYRTFVQDFLQTVADPVAAQPRAASETNVQASQVASQSTKPA